MSRVKYYMNKILSRFSHNSHEYMNQYYRNLGISIGDNTHIFSEIVTSEPYLISIGSNCTIATNVCLLTHDASIGIFLGRDQASDLCGEIIIGDNCFIGAGVIIMYGVHIPNNTIIAAGSVVTRSPEEEGCIIGGNPAKRIGTVDAFLEKTKQNRFSLHGMGFEERKQFIKSCSHMYIRR